MVFLAGLSCQAAPDFSFSGEMADDVPVDVVVDGYLRVVVCVAMWPRLAGDDVQRNTLEVGALGGDEAVRGMVHPVTVEIFWLSDAKPDV